MTVCDAIAVKDDVAFECAVGRCIYCGGFCGRCVRSDHCCGCCGRTALVVIASVVVALHLLNV